MKMVILSGKGGTGKSCITSAIAITIEKCILVDADVDCPNQHILFKGKEISRKSFSASKLAVIGKNEPNNKDYEGICEFGAIKKEGNKLKIIENKCEGCKACVIAFPELEIKLVPRDSGELIVKETEKFPLVYGKLVPGEAGSGRVVFEIKKIAERISSENEIETTLIDAPAGIGCPVIAAVTGCDYVLGVVEPTPASITNLERALEIVKHFNIPYSIVMNKQGISKKYENEIRKKFGELIIAEIPYDEEVPFLLAEGKPPLLGKGKAAESLKMMAERISKVLK